MEEITLEDFIYESLDEIKGVVEQRFASLSEKMLHYAADLLDELTRGGCIVYDYDGNKQYFDRNDSLFSFLFSWMDDPRHNRYVESFEDWLCSGEFNDSSLESCYSEIAKSTILRWAEDSGIELTDEVKETILSLTDDAICEIVVEYYGNVFPADEMTVGEFLDRYATGIAEVCSENYEVYEAQLQAFTTKLEAEADAIPLEKRFTIDSTNQKFMEDLYRQYTQREVSLLVWRNRLGTPRGRKFFDFQRIVREEIEAEKDALAQKNYPISVNPKDYFSL